MNLCLFYQIKCYKVTQQIYKKASCVITKIIDATKCFVCIFLVLRKCGIDREPAKEKVRSDGDYYNREVEDEHCTLLVMVPLG